MPRRCTICAHKDRKLIDGMIANKEPYLRIATKFGLNDKTVLTHGKKHVLPFIETVELQAQAAVVRKVQEYYEAVYLPHSEKARFTENKLWADFLAAKKIGERMLVHKELIKQQQEQAKIEGAYTKEQENQQTTDNLAKQVVARLLEKGWTEPEAWGFVKEQYPDVSVEGVQ